ncbi:FYN-binding protein 1 [Aplochiton taeniatus]
MSEVDFVLECNGRLPYHGEYTLQDNKADVRAITARFNAGKSNATNGTPSPGHPGAVLHSVLSSGPTTQPKKPILESLSSGAVTVPSKPNHLISTKSAPEVRDMAKFKARANVFANTKEGSPSTAPFVKPQFPLKPVPPHPSSSQDPEAKSPGPKPPPYKPSLSSALLEAKPVLPKPSPAVTCKPSSFSPTPPKVMPQNKPNSSVTKLRLQNEEAGGTKADSIANARPFPPPSCAPKPTSNFKAAQNAFNRDKSVDHSEEWDRAEGTNKKPLCAVNSTPPIPPISKKPSFINRQMGPASHALGVKPSSNSEDPFAPKRNPLPNILALGTAPSKPNRPPEVNLKLFMGGPNASTDEGPGLKKTIVPPPLTSNQRKNSSKVVSPPTSQPVAPSLPPRPLGAIIQPDPEENYDDIASLVDPPPPPSIGHCNQKNEAIESDEELYEDLDERWGDTEVKEQEKKREKDDKKRQEAEKKEQKERERKEQEARKKFKLSGPLPVIHRAQARVDSKGNKIDLSLKQGDFVDIVRVMDNPGGRWLGRTQDGTYGYVKTDAVEVDFDSLKRHGESLPHQMDHDPDVYDDIDVVTSNDFNSGIRGPGVVLPPPPEEAGGVYDDLDDPRFNVSPPLPLSSPPTPAPKTKPEEMDPKKQKKFEKEEKDFRKKFKFDGEIKVLYPVTVVPSLTNKKWSGKDLPIRAGETLDVIAKSTDNRLICRNDEGKCK